mgnify:CR=1 FL=1
MVDVERDRNLIAGGEKPPPKGSKSDSRARDRTGNHLGSVLTWRCERDIITIRPRDLIATYLMCSKTAPSSEIDLISWYA